MRAGLVDTRNQQSDTIRPPSVVLGVDLSLLGNRVDDAFDGDGAGVEETGAHGLLTHKVAENAGIGGKTGEGWDC